MSSNAGYSSLFGKARSPPKLSEPTYESGDLDNNIDRASSAPTLGRDDQVEAEELRFEQDFEVVSDNPSDLEGGPDRLDSNVNRWRYLTHNERSLAASLDRLEDDDLAIHLYNTHSLKRRLYDTDLALDSTQRSSQERPRKRKIENWDCKLRWIQPHDERGNQTWYPSRVWSAWPLEPDVVPRPGERKVREYEGTEEEEKWTTRRNDDWRWKPSQELEEILLAEMTKCARERFEQRPWEDQRLSGSETMNRKRTVRTTQSRGESSTTLLGANQLATLSNNAPSNRIASQNRGRANDYESSSHKGSAKRKPFKHDGFRSDGYWSRNGVDISGDEIGMKNSSLRPVVMADDDRARKILEIPIRHILHKLDKLLMGLHYSRHNHRTAYGSDSETDTQTSRESSVAETSRARTNIKSRKSRSRSASNREKNAPNYRARSSAKLRSRDWSELLGIATMTGWDSKLVKRAAVRCSQLFGEKMYFRDFRIDNKESYELNKHNDKPGDTTSTRKMYGGIHEDGFMSSISLD